MQQNHAIWLGGLILVVIVIILLLIWMFNSPPKNEVIVIKKDVATNAVSKNLISTPVVEGVVIKTDEYDADETIYSPQNTEVLTDGVDMSKYSPVEEDVYLTPPVSQD